MRGEKKQSPLAVIPPGVEPGDSVTLSARASINTPSTRASIYRDEGETRRTYASRKHDEALG